MGVLPFLPSIIISSISSLFFLRADRQYIGNAEVQMCAK